MYYAITMWPDVPRAVVLDAGRRSSAVVGQGIEKSGSVAELAEV
jgi:hypothetical protein